MTSQNVQRVRFVRTDDRDYRYLCGHHARMRWPGPRRAPTACWQAASVCEEIVRRRLGRMIGLRPERILAYQIQDGLYSYRPQYREIDAVSGSLGAELRLFEIKVTRSRGRATPGLEQLKHAADIAGTRGGRISRALIWVDTDPRDTLEDPEGFTVLKNLEALAGWNGQPDCCAFVRIPGGVAWSWRTEEGLDVDDGLFDRAQEEQQKARETRTKRQCLKKAGVPRNQWPAPAGGTEPRRPRGVHVVGSTKAPDTAMSIALRRILNAKSGRS